MILNENSNNWDELYEDLRKISKRSDNLPNYLRHLTMLFVINFEKTINKRLEIEYWKILKKLIDDMKSSSNNQIVYDNVLNLSIGFLSDLCLFIHDKYQIPNFGLPQFLTFSNTVSYEKKEIKSITKAKVFCSFIMLRMGDLMRYKGHNTKSREFYEISVKINQADGAAWNQLGVVSFNSAHFLESVYCHTRALFATLPFHGASTNLSSIFRKYANRNISNDMPLQEKFVSILAKLHFLVEINKNVKFFKEVGREIAESKEMIVSLMGICENLERGTKIECDAIDIATIILTEAFQNLIQRIMENPTDERLQLLSLFLRLSSFCDFSEINIDDVVNKLNKMENSKIEDAERFDHFRCFSKKSNYHGLTYHQLSKWLQTKDFEENENTDQETIIDTPSTSMVSINPKTDISTISFAIQNDEESDEEILQRATRRKIKTEESDSDERSDDIENENVF